MTKKEKARKEFQDRYSLMHAALEPIVASSDPIIIAAAFAVCCDAAMMLAIRMSEGDFERAAKLISDAINMEIDRSKKLMHE